MSAIGSSSLCLYGMVLSHNSHLMSSPRQFVSLHEAMYLVVEVLDEGFDCH